MFTFFLPIISKTTHDAWHPRTHLRECPSSWMWLTSLDQAVRK